MPARKLTIEDRAQRAEELCAQASQRVSDRRSLVNFTDELRWARASVDLSAAVSESHRLSYELAELQRAVANRAGELFPDGEVDDIVHDFALLCRAVRESKV